MTADLPFPSPVPVLPGRPPATVRNMVLIQFALVLTALAGTVIAAFVALTLWLSVGPCGPGETTTLTHRLGLKGGLALVGLVWAAVPALSAHITWRSNHPGPAVRSLSGVWGGLAALAVATTLVIVVRVEPSPLCL